MSLLHGVVAFDETPRPVPRLSSVTHQLMACDMCQPCTTSTPMHPCRCPESAPFCPRASKPCTTYAAPAEKRRGGSILKCGRAQLLTSCVLLCWPFRVSEAPGESSKCGAVQCNATPHAQNVHPSAPRLPPWLMQHANDIVFCRRRGLAPRLHRQAFRQRSRVDGSWASESAEWVFYDCGCEE